ncbi:MAG: DUF2975 domain-containing protein [Ruminococcaceae bacterium]|nr:DUF2975 domain-containing protein [Oscillospiraceae bacterium]
MEQKALSNWLKIVLLGVGLCGLIVYFFIIPSYGQNLAQRNPEFAHCYVPWLVFLWITAMPCYAALALGWRIAANIGRDQSFSRANAEHLKRISWLAACDSAYFFVGNVVLLLLNMSHPGITLLSLLVVFAGIAVTVAAAALSHLVQKAAVLQEQSDLTI